MVLYGEGEGVGFVCTGVGFVCTGVERWGFVFIYRGDVLYGLACLKHSSIFLPSSHT